MGKKCTKAEKTARVEELADLIVKGNSQRWLQHHVWDSWGACRETARVYIYEARAIVREDLADVDRTDMLASKVQLLEQMAADAAADERESNAIGAIRLLKVGWLWGREEPLVRQYDS